MNILLAEAKAEKARIAARTHFAAVDSDDPGFEPGLFGNGNIVKKKPKNTVFTSIFGFDDENDSTVEVVKPRGKKRSGQDGGPGLKIVNAKKKTPLVQELLKKNR